MVSILGRKIGGGGGSPEAGSAAVEAPKAPVVKTTPDLLSGFAASPIDVQDKVITTLGSGGASAIRPPEASPPPAPEPAVPPVVNAADTRADDGLDEDTFVRQQNQDRGKNMLNQLNEQRKAAATPQAVSAPEAATPIPDTAAGMTPAPTETAPADAQITPAGEQDIVTQTATQAAPEDNRPLIDRMSADARAQTAAGFRKLDQSDRATQPVPPRPTEAPVVPATQPAATDDESERFHGDGLDPRSASILNGGPATASEQARAADEATRAQQDAATPTPQREQTRGTFLRRLGDRSDIADATTPATLPKPLESDGQSRGTFLRRLDGSGAPRPGATESAATGMTPADGGTTPADAAPSAATKGSDVDTRTAARTALGEMRDHRAGKSDTERSIAEDKTKTAAALQDVKDLWDTLPTDDLEFSKVIDAGGIDKYIQGKKEWYKTHQGENNVDSHVLADVTQLRDHIVTVVGKDKADGILQAAQTRRAAEAKQGNPSAPVPPIMRDRDAHGDVIGSKDLGDVKGSEHALFLVKNTDAETMLSDKQLNPDTNKPFASVDEARQFREKRIAELTPKAQQERVDREAQAREKAADNPTADQKAAKRQQELQSLEAKLADKSITAEEYKRLQKLRQNPEERQKYLDEQVNNGKATDEELEEWKNGPEAEDEKTPEQIAAENQEKLDKAKDAFYESARSGENPVDALISYNKALAESMGFTISKAEEDATRAFFKDIYANSTGNMGPENARSRMIREKFTQLGQLEVQIMNVAAFVESMKKQEDDLKKDVNQAEDDYLKETNQAEKMNKLNVWRQKADGLARYQGGMGNEKRRGRELVIEQRQVAGYIHRKLGTKNMFQNLAFGAGTARRQVRNGVQSDVESLFDMFA